MSVAGRARANMDIKVLRERDTARRDKLANFSQAPPRPLSFLLHVQLLMQAA